MKKNNTDIYKLKKTDHSQKENADVINRIFKPNDDSIKRIQAMYDRVTNIDKIIKIPAPVKDEVICPKAISSGKNKSGKNNKTRLTESERYRIYELKKAGHSQREIAAIMGRSPATINRVLKRNSNQSDFWIFVIIILFSFLLALFLNSPDL